MVVNRYGQQKRWREWVWIILTIHALLLPLYGPLVDHHFAELLPYHSHLYLKGAVDHTHYYDLPHRSAQMHQHDQEQTEGVVSIPAHELGSLNLLLLSLVMVAQTDGVLPPLPAEGLIGLVEGAVVVAEGVFLRPAEQPPRAGKSF
jgi:hypothetical protein